MLIDVTVKIPEERLADLYELAAHWLSGGQVGDTTTDTPVEPKAWTNSDDDLPLARSVWEKFSPLAKAVFSLLLDRPGRDNWVSSEDLVATLGIPNGKSGLAGVLAWPARYCAAVNRFQPWSWEYGPGGDGANYWVEPEIADLFKRVRD